MSTLAYKQPPMMTSLREFQSGATQWQPGIRRNHSPPPYWQTSPAKPFDPSCPIERSFVLHNIDRIFANIRFDFSCLDSVEGDLYKNPTDSFEELCWLQSVDEDDDSDDEDRGSIETISQVTCAPSSFADDEDSDEGGYTPTISSVDLQPEWHEDFISSNIPTPQVFVLPLMVDDESPESHTVDSVDTPDDDKVSFMIMDPQIISFPMSDPSQTVHFFPTSKRDTHRKPPSSNPFARIYSRIPGLMRWNS